jgi:predicted nucleic acid-binding protein
MSLAYVDTNVFIRFLTNDHSDHSPRAYSLFKQLETGTQTATTAEMVIAEVVHILSSRKLYNLPRQEVQGKLLDLLSLKGLKLTNKPVLRQALALYAQTNLDFVDAYLAAYAQRTHVPVISFDRDFDKIPDVQRVEP